MDINTLFYKNHVELDFNSVAHEVEVCYFDRFSIQQHQFKTLKYFALVHVFEGKGTFKLGLDNYELQPEALYFGYPGQIIGGIDLSEVSGYVLYADIDFLLKTSDDFLDISLFQLYSEAHFIPMEKDESNRLKKIGNLIASEKFLNMYRKQGVLVSLVRLHILFTDRCFYKYNLLHSREIHPKISALFTILNIDKSINLKVSDYAKKFAISPNYLNDLVKRHTGKSLKGIIKEKTIQKACVYLLHTSFSVKEISFMLNYNYPQYFNRDFKQAKGMTPFVYRKEYR